MVIKINPELITDDMMYESMSESFVPTAEIEAWHNEHKQEKKSMRETMLENQMWWDIRRAAKTNITLQDALDQCIMIYKLSKEYKDGI